MENSDLYEKNKYDLLTKIICKKDISKNDIFFIKKILGENIFNESVFIKKIDKILFILNDRIEIEINSRYDGIHRSVSISSSNVEKNRILEKSIKFNDKKIDINDATKILISFENLKKNKTIKNIMITAKSVTNSKKHIDIFFNILKIVFNNTMLKKLEKDYNKKIYEQKMINEESYKERVKKETLLCLNSTEEMINKLSKNGFSINYCNNLKCMVDNNEKWLKKIRK